MEHHRSTVRGRSDILGVGQFSIRANTTATSRRRKAIVQRAICLLTLLIQEHVAQRLESLGFSWNGNLLLRKRKSRQVCLQEGMNLIGKFACSRGRMRVKAVCDRGIWTAEDSCLCHWKAGQGDGQRSLSPPPVTVSCSFAHSFPPPSRSCCQQSCVGTYCTQHLQMGRILSAETKRERMHCIMQS